MRTNTIRTLHPSADVPDKRYTKQELLNWIDTLGSEPPPPVTHVTRHQLLNFDFWFIFAALGCMLAITSSFIPLDMFEPLVFGAITLLIFAMISNLTRDRQIIQINRTIRMYHVKWGVWGWLPKVYRIEF